jgi:hypothetical protein
MNPVMEYAIRVTFGFIHAIFITLVGLGLALFFPSLTSILFGLVGFLILPVFSCFVGFLCNLCISYVTHIKYNIRKSLQTCWWPAAGIFAMSLFVMPLEYIHPDFFGDFNLMFGVFLIGISVLVLLIQIYSGLQVQLDFEEGASPMKM